MREGKFLHKSSFLRINELKSVYSKEYRRELDKRYAVFLKLGGLWTDIYDVGLMAKSEDIFHTVSQALSGSSKDLVVDISSMPKRFFFALVRIAMESSSIENLVITYSVPACYSKDHLAEDPETYQALPLFSGSTLDKREKTIVIGAGYELLGLPGMLEDFREYSPKILLPFSMLPDGAERNWEFIRALEPNFGDRLLDPTRVSVLDVPEIFERLRAISQDGERFVALAPFGPKTMSLSMCLFAIATLGSMRDSPVFYTQPLVYNPRYSQGIRSDHLGKCSYAYCAKVSGKSLYRLI